MKRMREIAKDEVMASLLPGTSKIRRAIVGATLLVTSPCWLLGTACFEIAAEFNAQGMPKLGNGMRYVGAMVEFPSTILCVMINLARRMK